MSKEKIGLVLEGGASRTMYTCGVLDAMLEKEITVDYMIGTSAGISYGISYLSKQFGRNREIMEKYMHDKRYMGAAHLFNRKNRSYYNLDFVFTEIPEKLIPFDFNEFRKFEGKCIATVSNIRTGKVEYLDMARDDKDFTELRATCALPILFQPIEINGEKYLDGGVCDAVPFERAFIDGMDKIIVILTRPRGYVKEKESGLFLMKQVYRKYPEFCKALDVRHEVYNNRMKRLYKLEKEGKAFIICPESTHGISRTERHPEILTPYYLEGLEHGLEITREIQNFIGN